MPRALAQPDPWLLALEANHRFLGTLATLDGLLRDDFGHFSDPSVRAAVMVFSDRIQAFASVHRTLEGPDGPTVDAAAHLARLCQEICTAHLAPRGVRCEMRVERAVLPQEVCRNLGLIVAELVTDAAKHGFVGRTDGQVWVTLRRGERGWICQVSDNGAGLRAAAADGAKLVRGLAASLGAQLDIRYDAGGVTTTVRLPDPTAGRWRGA
jgi:two-component sensor histidine kinase